MTNLKALSMVVVLMTVAVVMGALAVLPASAPPARGDPPVTEGAGGGTGAGVGVDPPGGITEAPPPEVPNTDGSWTATVGGTEFAGLTEADVGRVLWRGERVIATFEDDDGLTQVFEQCEEFPRIELRSAHSGDESFSESITVRLDYSRCAATHANIKNTRTEVSDSLMLSGPVAYPLFGPPYATSTNIAWTGGVDTFERYAAVPVDSRHHPSGSSRWSEFKGILRAVEIPVPILDEISIGNRLTETKLTRCYTATPELATAAVDAECRSWSPSHVIRWMVDDCDGDARDTNRAVIATANGSFHADTTPPLGTVNMPTDHNISLRLEGESTQRDEIKSCAVDPPSIEDLRATFIVPKPLGLLIPVLIVSFGADFDCEYSDRVFQ